MRDLDRLDTATAVDLEFFDDFFDEEDFFFDDEDDLCFDDDLSFDLESDFLSELDLDFLDDSPLLLCC